MNPTCYNLVLLGIIALASQCFSSPAPEPLPTADDAHHLFTDGKFRETVKSISKIAASKEWQAKQFDKYDLLMLKGEAHLKLKESVVAASAFEAASKETEDKPKAALAHTTAVLIKKCIGTNYVPKAGNEKRIPGKSANEHITIDIIDPESRKQALLALWQDERNALEKQYKAATEGANLQAPIDAAPIISRLHDYDLAAHGNDGDTAQAAGLIATHSKDLLLAMLEKMNTRISEISTKANKVEKSYTGGRGNNSGMWRKHGLEGKEPAELKDFLAKADKVPVAVKILSDNLMPESGFYSKVLDEAKSVMEKAEKALNDNYAENPNRS